MKLALILALIFLSLTASKGAAALSCEQVFRPVAHARAQYLDRATLLGLLNSDKSTAQTQSDLENILTKVCTHDEPLLAAYLKPVTESLEKNAPANILSIFKYFDLMTLSNLYRTKIKEIPNLEFVAKATHDMEERILALDVKKIKNFDDFAQAAGTIKGGPMKIRNYSVVMSAEEAKAKAGILLSPELKHNLIENSRFLGMTPASRSNANRIEVEYLSLTRILSMNLYQYFKPELKEKLLNFKARNPTPAQVEARAEGREASALLRESLQELVGQLLHPQSKAVNHLLTQMVGASFVPDHFRGVLLYQAFISIHPFEDGNGRSSRLYYEWLMQNLEGHSEHLELASFDADLFLERADFKNFVAVSELLNAWIANAKDETQFRERLTLARKLIEQNYEYLVPLFN
jgi:hypothetical protein